MAELELSIRVNGHRVNDYGRVGSSLCVLDAVVDQIYITCARKVELQVSKVGVRKLVVRILLSF